MSSVTEAGRAGSAIRFGYRHATALACILCGLLTIVSLWLPPGLNYDPGVGMLELRTLTEGGPANSIVSPDPTDISKDRTQFITWWSPGQYVIPGVLTLVGLKLGPAISITVGLFLLCCLLGWIRILKHFDISPQMATIAIAFLSVFTYSTIDFRFYTGGEILLQGITPWLILAGIHVPRIGAFRAASIAFLAILIGFFAKLTGILVALAALTAGSIIYLLRLRRITIGMLAGAAGAMTALGLFYATWYSWGPTAATGPGFVFRWSYLFFAAWAPWGAGLSWMDNIYQWIYQRDLSSLDLFLLPPVVFFSSVILWGSLTKTDLRSVQNELTKLTIFFYAFYALSMAFLYMRGGPIQIHERYFRPPGMLIFICALGVADRLPRRSIVRFATVAFCGLLSLYGLFSLVSHDWQTSPVQVDPYSRTREFKVNVPAIDYAKGAFAREGRDALFVLPHPDAANAFPLGARIVALHIDAQSDASIAARKFFGRVPGHVYVLMPTRTARAARGPLLLKEFADYPLDGWERHEFGGTTVFVQAAPAA